MAAAGLPRILPPGASGFFQQLLPPSELTRTLDIEIRWDRAVYRFKREAAVVEIELREASACAKPAGPLCVQIVAERGPGADALAAEAMYAIDRAARATRAPSPWMPPSDRASPRPTVAWLIAGERFILLVLAGVLVAAFRRRRLLLSRAAAVPVGLLAGAFAVRLAAHPVTADIRDVLGSGIGLETRRAGWSSYLHLLFSALPATYESVWSVHRVLGALAAPLLYVVMRRRFSELAATAGGATLAVLPLAARFSVTDTPYVPLCAAFLGAVAALDVFVSSGSRGACALGLGLLTCAAELRPDGPWLVVPALLLLACRPIDRRLLARPSVLILLACFLAINAPFAWWGFVGHRSEGAPAPSDLGGFRLVGALFGSPWRDLDMSPWPVALLVVAGAVVALRSGRAGVLWLVATVVAEPLVKEAIAQYSNARHHLPSVHLACGLAGLAVAALVDRLGRLRRAGFPRPAAVALAASLPVAASLPRLDLLTRMWTPQLELERLRAGVRALDQRCLVVTLLHTTDAGLTPSVEPGVADLMDVGDFLAAPPQEDCIVYYRAANCSSPDVLDPKLPVDRCRAFEEAVRLSPIAEWTLPAIPYRGERYSRDPLPVGLYRVGERR